MTPQECLYESVKGRLLPGMTKKLYCQALDSWEIFPVYEGDECIGCAIRKGTELHIGLIKHNRHIRKILREALGDTIRRYGYATTIVSENNINGLKFCERLGFERDWEGFGIVCMKCVRSPYV